MAGHVARLAAAAAVVLAGLAAPSAAVAQPAASQVTPRSLRPEPQAPPPPPTVELPPSLPSAAPPGAENLHVTPARIVVEGEFPDMARASRRLLAPLEGQRETVADLYRAAAQLERAYVRAGYVLARVAVPRQSVVDGGPFRLTVIDGFIETVDVQAVPAPVRRPIRTIMRGLVGRRRLKGALLQAKLAAAGQVAGVRLRSTLAQGETPGGARLILDGGFSRVGLNVSAANNFGPAFNNWGLSVQGQLNSPTGSGEQAYVFLAGSPRLDQTFSDLAPRRIGGGGVIWPIIPGGLEVNPEFTVSDTHPVAGIPILATHDRMYRGALNWTFPVPIGVPGAASAKIATEVLDERNDLPYFRVALFHDRLTVLRAGLSWDGAWQSTGLHAAGTLSQGVAWFGARSRADAFAGGDLTSRGSDPLFTKLEANLGVTQPLAYGVLLNLTGRAQTSFHHLLPASETFDLTSGDALSSYTAGALVSDAGVTVRAQVQRQWARLVGGVPMAATPYLFVAEGQALPVEPDTVTPTRALDYGLGVRVEVTRLPWGASPYLSLEYGHADPDRGLAPQAFVMATLGVQF